MKFAITITIISILSLNKSALTGDLKKCCKWNEEVLEYQTNYTCKKRKYNLIDSNFKGYNFFNENKTGECFDVYSKNNYALFSVKIVNNTEVIQKKDTSIKLFPKCCRLGYKYNETFHSCAKKKGDSDFSKISRDYSFFDIGMTDNRIVTDEIFDSSKEFNFKDTRLILKNNIEIAYGKYCIDSTLKNKIVVRREPEESEKICEKRRCIRKCCQDGFGFEYSGKVCRRSLWSGVDLHYTGRVVNPNDSFVIVHDYISSTEHFGHDPGIDLLLDEKGTLIFQNKEPAFNISFKLEDAFYCIETFIGKTVNYSNPIFYKKPDQEVEIFKFGKWMKMLSCIFLFLTIAVYLILPRMRNFFGKILLCYNVATFLNFLFQCLYEFLGKSYEDVECKVLGYVTILACIWSFTWLHILCIDIWLSFGSPKTSINLAGNSAKKLLLRYFICGWGIPIVWVSIIAIFSETDELPPLIQPHVGRYKCFLEDYQTRPGNYGHILFLILPIFIQQIINTVLFIKTVCYCLKIRSEIRRMNDGRGQSFLSTSAERLGLIMKLSVIMGVHILFEFLTIFYNFRNTTITTYIEYVGDSITNLQGVFIFIIFICKKKICRSLLEKCSCIFPRRAMQVPASTNVMTLEHFEESGMGQNERVVSNNYNSRIVMMK